MKSTTMTSAVAAAVLATAFTASALPTVSDVTMSQDSSRKVTISYVLTGEDGIVTVDIQTNFTDEAGIHWVSIGPENLKGFGGDVHRLVQPTTGTERRTMTWHPDVSWPGERIDTATARAVVTAWDKKSPPDWMIVHLLAPYDVTYYPFAEMIPDGITAFKYKTEYMPFRKIPAKGVTYWAGTPATRTDDDTNKRHQVLFTYDYYMAVYEMTVSQFNTYTGTALDTSNIKPKTLWEKYFVTAWRGTGDGAKWPTYNADGSLDWVTSHKVAAGSNIDKFRQKTGLEADLPTEAEFDFACRAGSQGLYYATCVEDREYGYTGAVADLARCSQGDSAKPIEVGTFNPNVWGLYDMLGNAKEACLDYYVAFGTTYADQTKVYVDPAGPTGTSGTSKTVFAGGDCKYGVSCGVRTGLASNTYEADGIRLCVPLR